MKHLLTTMGFIGDKNVLKKHIVTKTYNTREKTFKVHKLLFVYSDAMLKLADRNSNRYIDGFSRSAIFHSTLKYFSFRRNE